MEQKIIAAILLLILGLVGIYQLNSTPSVKSFLSKAGDLEEEFQNFQWKYDKVYNDATEESKRFAIFTENYQRVQKHNSEKHSFKVAINQFSDLTKEEFSKFLGYKSSTEIYEITEEESSSHKAIPDKVDWRFSQPPKVGPVYDQGQCGSCWAFSTAQAIEGLYPKAHGKFQQFSAQEILDCAGKLYLEFGCNGGNYERAFTMVKLQGSCPLDKYAHPYQAKVLSCEEKQCTDKFKISGHKAPKKLSKDDLLAALAGQPLSVAIQADEWAFQHYSSGIISKDCGTKLNHAVLAVGYDLKEGYITIKNSWSEKWGDQGFVKLAITDGAGICGVNSDPCYPY